MKALAIAAAVTALLATGGPVAARSLDAIMSAGELHVGVNPNYPPTAMYDSTNQLVGFDVDLANKLASMLGVKVSFVTVDPNSRIPFLTSGRIDMVMGGMTRLPERAKLIDFTTPIMTETLGALTVAGHPFTTLMDLNKATVTLAEVRGTTPIPWIAANLPLAKVVQLDNHPDVLRAVALGQIAKSIDAKWQPLQGHANEVDWDCIGVAKTDVTLRRWLNVALFSLEEGDFVAQDYKKWYGFDMAAPIPAQPYF
jgi:polar amino acid transport system substrate-binding protein